MIRRTGGRTRFCCAVGAEQDPAIVREIQAYLMMSCRCRAFVGIGREGMAVHFEQPGEAYLFAEVWAAWATASSAPAQIPSERLPPDGLRVQPERITQIMPLRSRIVLKSDLSGETLDAVRDYLGQFLDRRHSLEYFDGTFSIYLHDRDDLRLVREQFPLLIANVQDLH